MELLRCSDLSFAYGGETVLKGVSFAVNAGDYLCVVGENGSGKSTLMKGLLGLKEPESGSIEYAGGLKRNQIGYLPQQTALQKANATKYIDKMISKGFVYRFQKEKDRRNIYIGLTPLGKELVENTFEMLHGNLEEQLDKHTTEEERIKLTECYEYIYAILTRFD